MAGRCPSCFIRLPLSGEPNCDCEPQKATGTARTAPLSDQGPLGALPDPSDTKRVCEPLQ